MPIPKKELKAKKRKRLDDMVQDAGLDLSFPAFATKLLRNWEDKKESDPTNVLLKKLVGNFK